MFRFFKKRQLSKDWFCSVGYDYHTWMNIVNHIKGNYEECLRCGVKR